MNHRFAIFALLVLGQSAVGAHSVDQGYKVTRIVDGGTVRIAAEAKEITCRLHGIVAPQRAKVFGQASRESLSELAYGRDVHVHIINTIDKGILGCRLFIDGKDISLEQVKRGMAWKFRDVTVDAEMLRAESDAKRRRLGIWSEPDPDQPVRLRAPLPLQWRNRPIKRKCNSLCEAEETAYTLSYRGRATFIAADTPTRREHAKTN